MTTDPTPAELGFAVTIGIAAITYPDHYIVAVSDRRISFYDAFPATEDGAKKIHQLTADGSWFLAFAAADVPLVAPMMRKIRAC